MPTRFAAVAGCCLALALGASAQGHDEARPAIEATVQHLAQELSTVCPIADPADQTALEDCRRALFTGSLLRRSLGRSANHQKADQSDSLHHGLNKGRVDATICIQPERQKTLSDLSLRPVPGYRKDWPVLIPGNQPLALSIGQVSRQS